jgi:hypothetical protein
MKNLLLTLARICPGFVPFHTAWLDQGDVTCILVGCDWCDDYDYENSHTLTAEIRSALETT